MKITNYLLEIEGIDKSGKDILTTYIHKLSNFKYVINVRGILSNLVYNDKFNRQVEYDVYYKPIIIYLDVEEDDRLIRCSLTKEPEIDANLDRLLFEKYMKILENKGITIFRYNTSKMTPYQIAKDFLKTINNT